MSGDSIDLKTGLLSEETKNAIVSPHLSQEADNIMVRDIFQAHHSAKTHVYIVSATTLVPIPPSWVLGKGWRVMKWVK